MSTNKANYFCTVCGAETEPLSQFCAICGNKLIAENEVNSSSQNNPDNKNPMVNPVKAISLGFRNYLNFSGRSSRAEYWWWMLFYSLIFIIPVIGQLINIVLIIPSISLTSRRLHDIGKTGWWQLWIILVYLLLFLLFIVLIVGGPPVWLICFILFLILTICWIRWMCLKGNSGPNKYGPDPRRTTLK